MNKSLSFILTLALTGALFPAPLAAQTASSLGKNVVVGGGTDAQTEAEEAGSQWYATWEVTGAVNLSTAGHTITIKDGGTLTIAAGNTLTLGDGTHNDKITVEGGGTLTNSGTISIAGTSATIELSGTAGTGGAADKLGRLNNQGHIVAAEDVSNGIDIKSAYAVLQNDSLIDLSIGGKLNVENGGTAATINSPGIILASSSSTSFAPAPNDLKFTGFVKYTGSKSIYVYSSGTPLSDNTWTDWHKQYFTAGVNLNVNGAKLTVPAGVTLTVPAKTASSSSAGALTVTGTNGELTVNGTLTNLGTATFDGKVTIAGTLINGEAFEDPTDWDASRSNEPVIAMSAAGANLTIESSATVNNYGILNFTAGYLNNKSANVHSPGIVLINVASGGVNQDGSSEDIASGYKKQYITNGAAQGRIEVLGTGNEWTEWHNKFLNTSSGDATTGYPVSQLYVNKGSALTIPEDVTLELKENANLMSNSGVEYQLVARGDLTVNGGITLKATSNDGAGIRIGHSADETTPAVAFTINGTVTVEKGSLWTQPAANVTIANGGKIDIKSGNGSAVVPNDGTNTYNAVFDGSLTVADGGALTISSATATASTFSGSLTVEDGGTVNVTGSATIAADAVIANAGQINVSGTLTNNSPNVISTGIIEVTGGAVVSGTDLKQGTIVNTNGKWLIVQGENEVSAVVQAKLHKYIADGDVTTIYLSRERNKLILPGPLVVPVNKTLTIANTTADGESPDKAGQLTGGLTSQGLTILTNFPVDNISGTIEGFIQTGTGGKITVYGKSNSWNSHLQSAFAAGDTLVILEDAALALSAQTPLTIGSNKVVQNDGTLTGPASSITIGSGELRKGKNSETLDGATFTYGNGRINTELRESFVSWPETAPAAGITKLFKLTDDVTQLNYVLKEKTSSADNDYKVEYIYGTPDSRTLTGVPKASGTTGYGYYGDLTVDYYAVTGIAIAGDNVVAGTEPDAYTLTLPKGASATLTAQPIADGDAHNPNATWQLVEQTAGTEVTDEVIDGAALTLSALTAGTATFKAISTEGAKEATLVVTVIPPVSVESVTLDKEAVSLTEGETTTLTATVTPDNATNKEVTWSSDNPDVATVEDGVVTAVAAGEAIITVTTADGDFEATATITVTATPIPVEDVKLDKEAVSLTEGQTITLTATVTPDNATNKEVTWSSDNTDVATVEDGVVTAVAAGEAIITVTTADGDFEATATITVTATPIPVEDVTLDKEAVSLTEGQTITLTATVTPDNATNKEVTWSSDNTDVATVEDGVVTAVAAGEAIITVTTADGDFEATATITVTATPIPVEDVTLDKEAVSLTEGQTTTLTATVTPDNATNKDVTWSSEPEGVVELTPDGLTATITAVAAGEATITVTTADGDFVSTATITVTATPIPVENVTLDKEAVSLTEGQTTTLTATVTPDNATNKEVTWSSDNTDVATVEDGVVTAVAAGEATITVTTVDGDFEATATITVTAAPIPVENVKLDKEAVSLTEGQTTTLTATIEPEGATNQNVNWEITAVEPEGAIELTPDGLTATITAVAAGEAIITVTTADGDFVAGATITVTATPPVIVPVTGIEISGISAEETLQIGETLQLDFTLSPEIGDGEEYEAYEVTWSSEHGNVSIDKDGVVTGEAEGTDSIYATVTTEEKTFVDTVAITVYAVHPDKVIIAGADSLGLQKGDTLQLHWSVTPANANNKEVTWATLDPTIAEVSDSGKITAKGDGETKLIVSTVDSARTDTIKVTVYTVHPNSVTISGAEAITLQRGKTHPLLWSVTPANANNKEVTWKSLNASVASVDSGKVTAKADGETQIVVTTVDSARTDTIKVTVYSIPIEGVRIADKGNLPALQMTHTLQLTADVLPAEANDWQGVTWRSYNPEIATVDKYGVVTGVSGDDEGDTAMIVATAVGTTFRDTVYIKVYTIYVEGISITENTGAVEEIAIRQTLQLHATVEPQNATNHDKTWKSDNTAVATVDKDGLVTGVAAGEANIVVASAENKELTDTLRLKVYKIDVESITIDNMPDSLAIGATVELVASVEPSAPTDTVVIWRSGNEAIAQVDAAGKVTGVSAGETYIIATSDGKQDSLTIKVYNVPVSGVSIAAADSLAVGDTLRLHATIEPANATNQAVTWSSDNTAVATVDETGLVTGVSEGEAHIFVTTVDGGLKDSVKVKVYTIAVEGVTIAAAVDSVGVGLTLKLTAKVTPDNATDKSVTWKSGNTAVATVSTGGTVTGKTDGEAYIYVTTVDGGYKDSVAIRVYTIPVPVTGVSIAGATDSLEIDSTLQLTAVITPEDADNKAVTWSSSDDEVATVSEDGLVTGVAEGEAIITVTTEDGEYTAEVTIEVYTGVVVPKITAVAIQSDSANLTIVTRPEGEEYDYGKVQLEAVVIVEGEGEVDYVVAWESDNEDVAVVDEEGLVTAVGAGKATITLTVTETATGEVFTETLDISIQTVGIAPVPATSVKVYIADNTLYVNSAVTEKVDIYTISGKLVYSAVKPAGEVQINLTNLSDGVLLIRGASGWVRKVVK